jgi:uncharacterized membrane protein SpoIIM required for sporulation
LSPASRSAAARWFDERLPAWRGIDDSLTQIERGKSAAPDKVLAADLAIARRAAPDGALTKYLARVYSQLHRSIFRSPDRVGRTIRLAFERDTPEVAKALRWHILAVAALFFGAAAAGAWLVASYPELATLFASEEMIEQVMRGELWTDGLLNVFPSSLLAVQIFTNNIAVSLFALCLGVLYGLGTIYIIGMNGMMLGGVFAFTAQHGLALRLFEFVCAHGFVELSVIFIAGAVGASLGEALARPGHLTRAAAFHAATARGARLMFVCVVFLVGAGVIEGYISPNPGVPLPVRLAVGLGYLALFVLVLTGALGRWLRPR